MALAYSPIEETKTAAEILAGYKAARARLWPKVPPKITAPNPPASVTRPRFTYSETQARVFMCTAHAFLDRKPQDVEVDLTAAEMLPRILTACAVAGDITVNEIILSSRKPRIVRPRQAYFYIARTLTKASLPQIGRAVGGKDHATVLHGYRLCEHLYLTNKDAAVSKIIARALGMLEGCKVTARLVKNSLTTREILQDLENIERRIELLNKQKSGLYKAADGLGYDVMAMRQVIHYRREIAKSGTASQRSAPSETFTQYLKELADDEF